MIVVASVSGGRTSVLMAEQLKRIHGDNLICVFMDTGAEHPLTYDFLRKVNVKFDLNIICIKAVISPVLGVGVRHKVVDINDLRTDHAVFKDYLAKNGTPICIGATCSHRMKTLAYRSWASELEGEYETWIGIRDDEPRRLKPKKGIRYFAEICDYSKQDVLDEWDERSFNLMIDEELGNCVFCVKKTVGKLALAIREEPILYKEFSEILESDKVREMPNRKDHKLIMYRGGLSLKAIEKMYVDITTEELISTLKHQKRFNTGSCSESCEGDFSQDY